MIDPVSLSALGGAVLSEGIKFLYGQATELLKAYRERRKRLEGGDVAADQEEVPIRSAAALDGTPAGSSVNGAVLDREGSMLVSLTGALSPYAQDFVEVDPSNRQLVEHVERMRALLEALYGQRFTLAGEKREPTGARVDVKQVLGVVHEAIGLDLQEAGAGSEIHVEQSAQEAQKAVAARIGKLGGR